jgi:hypothetical protein
MDNKEIKSTVNLQPVVIDEEALEFQRKIAEDVVKADIALEQRKSAIIREVKANLAKLIPVSITSEMDQLGLSQEVQALINDAEAAYKITRFFRDDDDLDDVTDPYWFLR